MPSEPPQFSVRLARDAADVRAAQRLRYEVFVAELGGGGDGVDHDARLECDRFDAVFDHLLLLDAARGDAVVGVYRVMREDQARAAGQFYSEDEYDLEPLRRSGRKLLELGRSCLHADYRGGAGMMPASAYTLLISAARRLTGRLEGGTDSFEAFIEVQDHLLTLTDAYAQRLVLDSFQAVVETADEGQVKELLGKVCALYALWHIEQDRGWFLEQHYIDATKAKAIRAEVNALLGQLRPHAVSLVNGFGIPDQLLAAPIAMNG
mgnify:CR=1 FL=1